MFPDVFQRINCSCPMMFSKQFSIALPKGSLGTWEQTVRNKGQNFGKKGQNFARYFPGVSQLFCQMFLSQPADVVPYSKHQLGGRCCRSDSVFIGDIGEICDIGDIVHFHNMYITM